MPEKEFECGSASLLAGRCSNATYIKPFFSDGLGQHLMRICLSVDVNVNDVEIKDGCNRKIVHGVLHAMLYHRGARMPCYGYALSYKIEVLESYLAEAITRVKFRMDAGDNV